MHTCLFFISVTNIRLIRLKEVIAYLSPSPQLGHVHATLLRCCLLGSLVSLLETVLVVFDICCWWDTGVVDVVKVPCDWRVWRICHLVGSFESSCTVGVVATIGVAAVAGNVWTVAGCSALAGITCTLPKPGIFCTGIDCKKPLVVFIPVVGWICIILPLLTFLIMLPCCAVKFASADAGISVNCCPCAPDKSED